MSKRVIELYKRLHKISREVFDQDARALSEAKRRIELEFKKNKHLEKSEEIEEKIKVKLVIFCSFKYLNI